MQKQCFNDQIRRLTEVYGEKAYTPERQKTLWLTFQRLSDTEFEDAVTFLIMTFRSTPLLKEFHEAVKEAEQVTKNRLREAQDVRDAFGFLRATYKHAEFSDTATRERVLGRINLVRDYQSRKITRKHFEEGHQFYDKAAGIDSKKEIAEMKDFGRDYLKWVKEERC